MSLLLDVNTYTEELNSKLGAKDSESNSKRLEAAKQFTIQDIRNSLPGYWNNENLAELIWKLSTGASKQDLEFIKLPRLTESVTAMINIRAYHPSNELHYLIHNFRESLGALPQWTHSNLIPVSEVDKQTIQLAEQFISYLFELISTNRLTWFSPHMARDDEGEISLEWWRNKKVLTVFINSSGQIEYLKTWGPHIWQEMEDGANPTDQELLDIWQWLLN